MGSSRIILKKYISIILLLTLIAPFLIGLRTYHVQIKKIKKSIKKSITEQIDKSSLVRLAFYKNEITSLNWKHSKEFEHQSEMYDIVHKEIKSDSIIYWCWLDNEEAYLEKSLNILIAKTIGKDDASNRTKDFVKQIIKKIYIQKETYFTPNKSESANNYLCFDDDKLITIPQEITIPPPRTSI